MEEEDGDGDDNEDFDKCRTVHLTEMSSADKQHVSVDRSILSVLAYDTAVMVSRFFFFWVDPVFCLQIGIFLAVITCRNNNKRRRSLSRLFDRWYDVNGSMKQRKLESESNVHMESIDGPYHNQHAMIWYCCSVCTGNIEYF